MKKVLIAACMLLGFGGIASAQKTTATAATPASKTEMKVVKKDPATAKVVKMKTNEPKKASMTKADGTADMRFKANKEKAAAPAATGPKKKDGTADMRYKANKAKS